MFLSLFIDRWIARVKNSVAFHWRGRNERRKLLNLIKTRARRRKKRFDVACPTSPSCRGLPRRNGAHLHRNSHRNLIFMIPHCKCPGEIYLDLFFANNLSMMTIQKCLIPCPGCDFGSMNADWLIFLPRIKSSPTACLRVPKKTLSRPKPYERRKSPLSMNWIF